MTRKRSVPKQRDELATAIVCILLFLLRYEVDNIYWVHRLRIRDGRYKKPALGLNERDGDVLTIYLDSALQKRPIFAARVLMHELLHLMFAAKDAYNDEKIVLKMEQLVWKKLTAQQKKSLQKKLPPASMIADGPDT